MKRVALCVASLTVMFSLCADAGQLDGVRQVAIHYDDINVKQPAGARILLSRIEAASEEVCGPAPDTRMLRASYLYRTCAHQAADRAVASLPFDLAAILQAKPEEAIAQR